ncbi:hypothetical protein [Lysobacter sp. CA199]|uniref:hypothetical protein n=1 Tax=Lysobacter sp. CA199 TaxID=3455608 RepID=UPI003F8D7930
MQAPASPRSLKQRYRVTIQRNGRKQGEAAIGELVTLALREIPECSGIEIVGRSQVGVEASFWADAYRLTCVLERHLNHFGLTWVSLELLDLPGELDVSAAPMREPMHHDQHTD